MFRQKGYFSRCILYGIIAIICLIGIKTLYIFFFIFGGLSGLYGYLAYKHRNDKPHPLLQNIAKKRDEKKQAKGKPVDGNNVSRKEIKSQYKKRLAEIEREFDFDYEAETDDLFNEDE
jgi:hypothetical protein